MPKSDNLTSSYVSQIEVEKSKARAAQRQEQRKATLPFTKPSPIASQEYIKELDIAKRKAQTAELRRKANTVELDTGERVDKDVFNSLTDTQQGELKTLGIDAFNELQKTQASEIVAQESMAADISNAIPVGAGEYISAEDYDKLSPEQQGMVKALGVTGYNAQIRAKAEYEANLPIMPRALPNQITETQLQDLQVNAAILSQKADSLAASLSAGKNIPSAFFDWVSGKIPSAIPDETLAQYMQIQDSLSDSDEWAKYFAAVKGSQVAKSYSDYLKTYTTDYKGKEFTVIPTADEIQKVIYGTMPSVIDATKAGETWSMPTFDVVGAIKSGTPETVLVGIGVPKETITEVTESLALQAKVQPYISENSINIWGALQGNITPQEIKDITGLDNQTLLDAIGGDAQIAYNDAIQNGQSEDDALDYAISYVKNMYATTGYTSARESIQIPAAAVIPSFTELDRITEQLRGEGVIDAEHKVSGVQLQPDGTYAYTITPIIRPTEAGVVYKEVLDYLTEHPDIAMTPEVITPLLAQGFDLQAITNAQAAFNQIQKVQEQQAAIDKINASIPIKEIPRFMVSSSDIAYIEDLKSQGLTDLQINELLADRGITLSDYIKTEPEYQYTAESLALYLRDNPEDGVETLKTAGFSDKAIEIADTLSKMQYDESVGFFREGTAPSYGEFMVGYLTQRGISKDLAEIYTGRVTGGAPDISQAEYDVIANLVKEGLYEYAGKYGTSNIILSEVAMPASLIFAPAKALAPDITIKDISGAEWAIGAGQVLAYAAMPFGGITGGVIGKALDIGASAAFALNTALEWEDLSLGQKIWSIGGNLGFLVLPYALGKLGKGVEMLKAYANPETRKLVQLASDAGAAVRKVEVIRAAESLETGALFAKTAGALQTAEGEARMLTTRLLNSLSRLDDISPTLLRVIESKSGVAIAGVTTKVGKAAKALKTAQQAYEDLASQVPIKIVTPQDKLAYKLASEAKISRDIAQKAFDKAMLDYADIMTGVKYERGSPLLEAERETAIKNTLQELADTENRQRAITLKGTKEGISLQTQEVPYISEAGDIRYRTVEGYRPVIQMESYIDDMGKIQYRLKEAEQLGMPIDERIAPITAEDIKLSNRMVYAREKAVLPYSEEISTYTEGGGATAIPSKVTPPEQIKVIERAALQAQINYLNTLGENARTIEGYTVADLTRKLNTIELITPQYVVPSVIPVAVLLDAIKPEVMAELLSDYNISPENISGLIPMSNLQLIVIAKKLGMTTTEIEQNIDAGILPQSIIYQAINKLPDNQTQLITQSISAAYPQAMEAIANIPKVIEWQQVSSIISPDMLQQASNEQLSQIEEAQSIISKINDDIKQSITQKPTIEQSQTIQEAQDIINQIKQEIYTQAVTETVTPPATQPIDITQTYTEEYVPPPEGEEPPPEKPTPKIPVKGDEEKDEAERKRKAFEGAIAWKQGIVWHAWKYPYKDDEEDLATFYKYPPAGVVRIPGKTKAQETVQLYLGKTPPPPDRKINMGIMDIYISATPDGKLQIKYIEDKEQSRGEGGWFGGKTKERRAKTRRSKKEEIGVANKDDFWSSAI